jgi:hypothetical protein
VTIINKVSDTIVTVRFLPTFGLHKIVHLAHSNNISKENYKNWNQFLSDELNLFISFINYICHNYFVLSSVWQKETFIYRYFDIQHLEAFEDFFHFCFIMLFMYKCFFLTDLKTIIFLSLFLCVSQSKTIESHLTNIYLFFNKNKYFWTLIIFYSEGKLRLLALTILFYNKSIFMKIIWQFICICCII